MDKERRIQTPHLPTRGWLVSHALIWLITGGVMISDNEARVSNLPKPPTPIVGPLTLEFYTSPLTPALELTPTPTVTATGSISRLASVSQIDPLIYLLKQSHNKKEFTVADTMKALQQASLPVSCTIDYEAGGGRLEYGFQPYDPYILDGPDIDHAFNYGIGQLNIKGKLVEFFKNFKNPFNPYEVVAYMNWAFANGQAFHWGPVVLGYC